MVKIYCRVLDADTEYKTLSITKSTTCREVIRLLLAKLRIKDRNPNLFYLTIDVVIKNPGVPIETVMILDDKACPAQLQSVYPYQGTKFTLEMKHQPQQQQQQHNTFNNKMTVVNEAIGKTSTLDSNSSRDSNNEKEYNNCTSRSSLTDESCSSTCTLDSCCSCDSSEVENYHHHHHQPLHSHLVSLGTCKDVIEHSSHIDWSSLHLRLENIN